MIEGAISWGALAAVLTIFATFMGGIVWGLVHIFGAFNKLSQKIDDENKKQNVAIKAKTDKLHERQSRLRSDLQGFRTEVAQSYVNNSHLTDVESRLTKSLDGLADEVRKLMDILLKRAG